MSAWPPPNPKDCRRLWVRVYADRAKWWCTTDDAHHPVIDLAGWTEVLP